MNVVLSVFLGAGIGGVLRHLLNQAVTRHVGSDFPWGILAVNIIGCFTMGLVAGYFAYRGEASMATRLFLTTGVLGGFTTFSAFSLDTVLLMERGENLTALIYVLASVIASIGALIIAMSLVRT